MTIEKQTQAAINRPLQFVSTNRGEIMDLDITEFTALNMRNFSASITELGQNAGAITWQNALNGPMLLDSCEKISAFKDYVQGFGAWDIEEITAWTNLETNALCLQFIAGDIRENSDTVYRADGRIFIYIGC